ncbi:MAG: hypothetical protein HYT80_08055 [Euryarchaeota archaeon]|nr:hypothetical protein [Euryarchaeota archaeon]
MADYYLPASIGLAIASTIVYAAVGYQVGRRPASAEDQLAKRMFQAWWYGLAGLSVFTPLVAILRSLNLDTFDTMLILVQFLLIVVFAAIAGLVYYLLYIYTGRSWVIGPVIAYFVVMIVWLEYILVAAHIEGWGVPPDGGAKAFLDASGDRIKTDPVQGLVFGLLISVPPLLSAIAFFSLYFKVTGAEQKYRIALVAASLVAWFGSSLVGTVTGLSRDPATQQAWQLTNMVVALCASCAVYLAYKPPAWVRRRWADPGGQPFAPA